MTVRNSPYVTWLVQISHKLLHLAATNCEDGGHYNTKWRIFWNLVTQKRRWLEESMAQSALGASNRGFVFKFQEFRTLVMSLYDPETCTMPFLGWIQLRFMAISLLFAALRTEQLRRFNNGGVDSITIDDTNRDADGFLTPVATACYKRVKQRNGVSPTAADEDFFLTIQCHCEGDHEPIRDRTSLICVEVNGTDGKPKGDVTGNLLCWYGNLELLLKHRTVDFPLFNQYNIRGKVFGSRKVGVTLLKKVLSTWADACGVQVPNVNNMWARQTFVNTGLRELQLPETMVMEITGHRNAEMMRKRYEYNTRTRSLPRPTPTFAREPDTSSSST